MLASRMAKSTSAAAIRELEGEMRALKAASGTPPSPIGLHHYYMACDIGWNDRLKAAFVQIHGYEPTGKNAIADRTQHCRWFWDHQESAANKQLVTAAHAQYVKDHERVWADEQAMLATAAGDYLLPAERQE
jgi:hypothetical protein